MTCPDELALLMVKKEVDVDEEQQEQQWRTQDQGSCIMSNWSENNASTMTKPSEANTWNPSATVMQSELDRPTDTSQGIKNEAVNYNTSDVFQQYHSEDQREEKTKVKCEYSTPDDFSSLQVNPWNGINFIQVVPNILYDNQEVNFISQTEQLPANISSDGVVKSEPVTTNSDDDQTPAGTDGMTTVIYNAVKLDSTSSTGEDEDRSADDHKEFKIELGWSSEEEEEPQDQPSAVYSPAQPMSDNIPGSAPNVSHECLHCSATFDLFSHLKAHMMMAHRENLQTASPLPSEPDAGHQIKLNTGKGKNSVKKKSNKKDTETKKRRHVCDVCSKAFIRMTHLKAHKLIHTGQRAFECDICKKAFIRAGDLKSHKMAHDGQKPFACDLCGKAFTRSSNLKEHKLTHSERNPCMCDVCGKSFARDRSLKMHKLIHTGRSPFVCKVCDRVSVNSTQFRLHMYTHTGERPYKCPHCSADFNQSNCLQVHIRSVHSSNRPHVCDECGAAFPEKSCLAKHKRTHTGEKPFPCDICGIAFAWQCTLRVHRRVHTGEKPYMCDICGNAFTRNTSLKQHKMIHTGGKGYACEMCGMFFSKRHTLTKHKKMTHMNENPNMCSLPKQ